MKGILKKSTSHNQIKEVLQELQKPDSPALKSLIPQSSFNISKKKDQQIRHSSEAFIKQEIQAPQNENMRDEQSWSENEDQMIKVQEQAMDFEQINEENKREDYDENDEDEDSD